MPMLAAMLLLATVSTAAPVQPQVIDDVFPEVGGEPCMEEPATEWNDPSCDDYHLDTALIEAAGRRDQSAIDLLQRRHEQTVNFRERFRIGAALLHRVPDDEAIWRELAKYAAEAVRFAPDGDKHNADLDAFCDEHGYDADAYYSMTLDAFAAVLADPRSRPIMVKALAVDDLFLMQGSIFGFAMQHDESALALIEERFSKFREVPTVLYVDLAYFRSEAADRLAAKYLSDDDREEYERIRHEEQK